MKTTKRQQTTKRNAQDLTLRNLHSVLRKLSDLRRRVLNTEAAIVILDKRQEEIEKVIADLALRLSSIEMPTPTELSMRDAAKRMMDHGE